MLKVISEVFAGRYMNYMTSRELKNIARDKMLGQYGTAIGAFMFMRLALLITLGACSSVFADHRILMIIASTFVLILEGVFIYGELSIYLKISVGDRPEVMDVVSGFRTSSLKAIGARMVHLIILFGCFYAWVAVGMLTSEMDKSISGSINLMSLCVFSALGIFLMLTYSQIMYFLQDFSTISVKEACKRSRELMRGNKLSLLFICIGFIPIYFIGVISFMVGFYFIHPYVKMTLTEFYLDRVRCGKTSENV